ncbi:MAG: TIGR01777 family oxidoreductase [Gemmataceae bacterium]|nr:TIGR01777 family oxidoreductase [Gemmataceae bacterium]
MRVFLTGGTGLIGARLIRRLIARGDSVTVLSRQANAWERVGQDVETVVGDPTVAGDWQAKVAEHDAVVNLAGTNLFAKRWNDAVKADIRESRLKSTAHVVEAMAKGGPKILVNGSAIGYYGPRDADELNENSAPGTDFMAKVCVEWEDAARAAEAHGIRVTMIRTGIVHDPRGGALQTLMLPFKLGLGGPVGMALNPADWGKQFWSWIHYADEVGILLLALDHPEATGPINATAPKPVTNKQFAKEFGRALGRPAFAPAPAMALRLLLGEVAEVITTGQRVHPAKALALGYQFQFPELGPALADLLKK